MDELARADKRITMRERVRTIDYLAWLADQANQAAAWLGEHALESEADKAELAAVHLLAVVALLERPFRPQLPPARWSPAQQGDPGSSDGPQTAQEPARGAYPQVRGPQRQM